MKFKTWLAFSLAAGTACWAAGEEPGISGWQLSWSDEFDGETIDRTRWDFDIGNGFYNYEAQQWIHGWGNAELQYYTDEPDNAFVRDGLLHLRAVKASLHGCGYTSARMKTRKRDGSPLFNQRYGKFKFRAKLPTGQGIWPAIWMLPQKDSYGPWAASGEIDILEVRGQHPNRVLGTLHYGSRWPANAHSSREYNFPEGGTIADFHVYTLEWSPGRMSWAVDGHTYATQGFWWSCSEMKGKQGRAPADESELNPWPAPFDQPFYLILNLAVGGRFPGAPDSTTPFPAEMLVDYVRVYTKTGGAGPLHPRDEGTFPFSEKKN